MLNPKNSASNKLQKKHYNPRSPLKLKNLSISSSSSSSSSSSICSSSFNSSTTATSISSEAPKGCLRFFLSNHSSNLSKNANNNKIKCNVASKNPKLAQNVGSFRGNLAKKGINLKTTDKSSHIAPHQKKLQQKFQERCDLYSGMNNKVRKINSKNGFCNDVGKKSSRVNVSSRGNAVNLRKPSKKSVLSEVNFSGKNGKFTPLSSKLVENGGNCGGAVSRSPTPPPPPVEASVSPEIQGGTASMVAGTPSTTCYAAGHVLSGVTDKRKCRPKGILTIGNNSLFESSFRSDGGEVNDRRDSIVPTPAEASVCWLSSPCGEKTNDARDDEDDEGVTNVLRLSSCEKILSPFELVGCSSSLSSSLGFSSEMFDTSNCTVTTSGASSTPCSQSSLLHSDLSSEYRGVLGPSLDHLVRCSSPPSCTLGTPIFNVEFSPKQGEYPCDRERGVSPDFDDSLGSGNVMQTPESNSSPSNFKLFHRSPYSSSKSPNLNLSKLNNDEIPRLKFEWDLDSVAEILHKSELDSPRPSFEFNPMVKLDSSINDVPFLNDIATGNRDVSPKPEVRISCSETDDLDCCRYLSDEEDAAASGSRL